MLITKCYTSCACNHTPTAADWGRNNLICYGSCNSVRIYDCFVGSGGKIIDTLCNHKNRVNSVRWIRGVGYEDEIVSGSSDGTAVVWSKREGKYEAFVLSGHEGTVNVVDGLYKHAKQLTIVVTASIDSTLKIWIRQSVASTFDLSQTISFGYGICMGMRITQLPKSDGFVLAAGLNDAKIHLFSSRTGEDGRLEFIESEVLTGHENWVCGLDFTDDGNENLYLASSSQDNTIRLWRFSPENLTTSAEHKRKNFLYLRSRLETQDRTYVISLESILSGHDMWVYSVSWSPSGLVLLSTSLDKTMLIWSYDVKSGLWTETVRVGEVGGNTLGFYGGVCGPDGNTIMGHGYHGAFHIWKRSDESLNWEPLVTVGGHFDKVVDLQWEPQGQFLVSVSEDQTTRVHAPWTKGNRDTTWHEIARPQVHGYDMSALAILSRYSFASSAEEKVIRAFTAPKNFVDNFHRICNISGDVLDSGCAPKGASVPSLGLSNKAVFENDNSEMATAKGKKDPYPEESYFTAVELSEPPTEETLVQNTLWPEVQKLYGHGYEVYALASTSDGSLLASSCKATKPEHAAIIIWETSTWKQLQKLVSHTLTVVQLVFSPDNQHLLSVSRDRRWSLFSRDTISNQPTFSISATTDKRTGIHTRIIWCCAWSHDSKYFATGSRDGKVVTWSRNATKAAVSCLGQYEAATEVLELKSESITALAFAPLLIGGSYLVGVGLEIGDVSLYKWSVRGWTHLTTLDNGNAHHLTVRRLAFRPIVEKAGKAKDGSEVLQLASCGSDHAVIVYDIVTSKL